MRRAGCRARSTAEGVGVVLLARVELQGQVVAEAVGHVLAGPARVHAPQFAAILEDRPIAVEALVFVDRIPLCDPAGQAPVVLDDSTFVIGGRVVGLCVVERRSPTLEGHVVVQRRTVLAHVALSEKLRSVRADEVCRCAVNPTSMSSGSNSDPVRQNGETNENVACAARGNFRVHSNCVNPLIPRS